MIVVVVAFLEFVILALFKVAGINQVPNVVASVFILILFLCMIAYSQKNKRLKPYSKYLIIAYLLRLFFLYVDLFAYPRFVLPDGHSDEEMFFLNAMDFAAYGRANRGTYPRVMGTLFKFIGTNRLYGQHVSMLFSIVALVYLAYTLSELKIDDKEKVRVYRVACLLPYNAILSALFMREAIIYMFLSFSFYFFVLWMETKKEKQFLIAAGFILPAAVMHSGTIAVLVGYIVIRLIFDNKRERFSLSFRNILITVIIVGVITFIINNSSFNFLAKFEGVDALEDIANTHSIGNSSYAQYVGNSNNPMNFLIYTPLRIVFFLLSPVPWMWRDLLDIIAFCFSTMFYVVSIFNTVRFLRTHEGKNRILVILLFVVASATVFVFAWGTSNAGTAIRHREKIMILNALLWALSSEGLRVNDLKRIKPKKKGSF